MTGTFDAILTLVALAGGAAMGGIIATIIAGWKSRVQSIASDIVPGTRSSRRKKQRHCINCKRTLEYIERSYHDD